MGLSSCNTEQFAPLLDHLQDAQTLGELAEVSRKQSETQTRGKITPSEEIHFTTEYLTGKSTKQIARESGRSRAAVSAAVSAAIKRTGASIRSSRASTNEEIQEMVDLRASGMSLVKIADRLGYSEKTVWTQLRNARSR